jgi:hypothetical protein
MKDDKELFQVRAMIISDKSLLNGVRRFVIETDESLTPDDLHKLISSENKLGYFTFAVRKLEFEDLTDLPEYDKTKYDDKKSPAQRLRSVLYLLHQKNGGKPEDFDNYYRKILEKLIVHYRNQLD